MKLASRTDPAVPYGIPYSYLNNPRIMKIVKESYGNLNERFNKVQGLATNTFPTPSFENCHYVLSGDKFVPIPMDISRSQFKTEETTQLRTTPMKNTSKSMFPKMNYNSDPAMLMPLPLPNRNKETKYTRTFQPSEPSSWMSKNNEFNVKTIGESQEDKTKSKNYQTKTVFCTGSIERLLKWNRSLEDVFCLYETIAPIVSLQEGRMKNQKIMLLRNQKGPILQVQYYNSTHIDINDFYIGQCLRCVGRMIGFNVLSAESIREATENEISTLSRLSYVCDYSVTHNLSTS